MREEMDSYIPNDGAISFKVQKQTLYDTAQLISFMVFSVCTHPRQNVKLKLFIQGVSRLEDITAGGDFLGLCDQKSSYKHVSDFGRLRSYDRLKLRREGKDY